MKRIYLVLCLTFGFVINCTSQEIPENTVKMFAEKYPTATKIVWAVDDNKDCEAKFKMVEIDYISNYDSKGNWIQSCHEINRNEVPIPIKAKAQKEFKGYRMESAKKVEKPNFDGYSVRLYKMVGEEIEQIDVLFDESGQVASMDKVSSN